MGKKLQILGIVIITFAVFKALAPGALSQSLAFFNIDRLRFRQAEFENLEDKEKEQEMIVDETPSNNQLPLGGL